MGFADQDKDSIQTDHVIPDHPIPPENVSRYSVERDPDAERDIFGYVESQAPDETVLYVEKVKQETVLGQAYEIWDVTTDKDRWWVITNLTNLYSQRHFPSLDYTLSFHIGLMMRLRSRPEGADSQDPHPFDEVFRRQEQAKNRHDAAIEVEDYQAVGMQLRECLLSLISTLRRRTVITFRVGERPQEANFGAWSDILINEICSGQSNKQLRQYLKKIAKETWQLVNWLVHDRGANKTASIIAIGACDVVVGHFIQIFERERVDHTEECPSCKSRHIRVHFDPGIEPDGEYYSTCGACGWSNHPAVG